MNFATETNATHLQWRLGRQQGAYSGGMAGKAPAAVAAQRTDIHTPSVTIPSPLG